MRRLTSLEGVLIIAVIALVALIGYMGVRDAAFARLLDQQQVVIEEQMRVLENLTGVMFPEGSTVSPSREIR